MVRHVNNELVCGVLFAVLTANACAIDIQTVLVSNAGNAGDPTVMGDGTSGYGAVAYEFEIGRYEVTNAQYVEFLNSVADADPNGVFHTGMQAGFNGGIIRRGNAGAYVYSPKAGYADKPVNYVTFSSAARFCNWLHNGQPVGPQGSATTESGAYTMIGATAMALPGSNGGGRTNSWKWALPTEHEWHKAAYGNPANVWTDFATGSNTTPISELPPGGTNSANYNDIATQLTLVGAYVSSISGWGSFDQNGNLHEWNEGIGTVRRLRGGNWDDGSNAMASDHRGSGGDDAYTANTVGFRVVRAVLTTGACCLPTAVCQAAMTPAACAAARGAFQGLGSVCDDVECDIMIGACCFSDGSCTDNLTAGACAAAGGLYRGHASVCAGAGCAPVGATVLVNAAAPPGGFGRLVGDGRGRPSGRLRHRARVPRRGAAGVDRRWRVHARPADRRSGSLVRDARWIGHLRRIRRR